MKKSSILICAMVFLVSCNNSGNKNEKTSTIPKTHVDSLLDEVLDGHDAGMARMGKMSRMENNVQHILGSLNKLSGKSKTTTVNYKNHLDSLLAELKSAEDGMNKWMDEFNMDSDKNDVDRRTQYLESEKSKVTKIKESMIDALHKADSLLKK